MTTKAQMLAETHRLEGVGASEEILRMFRQLLEDRARLRSQAAERIKVIDRLTAEVARLTAKLEEKAS